MKFERKKKRKIQKKKKLLWFLNLYFVLYLKMRY